MTITKENKEARYATIRRFLKNSHSDKYDQKTDLDDIYLRYGILQRCHQLDIVPPPVLTRTLADFILESSRGDRLTRRPDIPIRLSFPVDLQLCRENLSLLQSLVQCLAADDHRRQRRSSSGVFDGLVEVSDSPQGSVSSLEEQEAVHRTTDQCTYRCDIVTLGRDYHRPVRANNNGYCYGNRGVISVSCGMHHTLVLTDDGQLWVSGLLNSNGRLGTGDDRPRPHPVVILPSQQQNYTIIKCAAAETHSLALTNSGVVFAFGSNRFGQVGTSINNNTSQPYLKQPRKIDHLKARIIDIAAGTRHSIALGEDGFVYGWGDNTNGQLGSPVLRHTHRKVHRIESLHEIIAISAADQSTMALTARHTVYAWGQGCPVPTKVVIAATITAISAAKYHNVALANDGTVYAWGFHGDSLGSAQRCHDTKVQLVELPEPAVAISASEYHTAVITAQGHLYTFGDAPATNIMGHAGVRWQPEPKQVPGIYRAVGVSAAKEHMAIMICTTVPPLPVLSQPQTTLADLASQKLAQRVDLFNVISILIVAERTQSEYLLQYCLDFLNRNMDGVLNVGQKSVMYTYIQEQISGAQPQGSEDAFTRIMLAGTRPGRALCSLDQWVEACYDLVRHDVEVARLWNLFSSEQFGDTLITVGFDAERERRIRKNSFAERSHIDLDDLVICTKELAIDTLAMLNKEARAIRKRLCQIAKLESVEDLTLDQKIKVARKPIFEADLDALGPAIRSVEAKIRSFITLDETDEDVVVLNESKSEAEVEDVAVFSPSENAPDKEIVVTESVEIENTKLPARGEIDTNVPHIQTFYCSVCSIKCPDSSSYYSHIDGRKHRNRIAQTIQEEKNQAAESLRSSQRMKMFRIQESGSIPNPKPVASPWDEKKNSNTATPRFKLPPPPHPVVDVVVQKKVPPFLNAPPNMSTTFLPPWICSPVVPMVETLATRHKSLQEIMEEEALLSRAIGSRKMQAQKTHQIDPIKSTGFTVSTSEALPICSLNHSLPSPARKEAVCKGWTNSASPALHTKKPAMSLTAIQKEEEDFLAKQDHAYANNGQWFIEKRERAHSLKDIQQKEALERQEQELIEEQKWIEAQIYEELRAQKIAEEKAQKLKRKNRARQKAKAQRKQQEAMAAKPTSQNN